MKFDTSQDAYLYYSKFAKDKGFAVSKRSSRKGIDGKLTDCCFACTRAGKARVKTRNPAKPRPQTKIGCPAHVSVVKQEDEKWKFNVIVLNHNHDLSPAKSRYFKSNRVLNEYVQRQLDLNDQAGIRTYKTFDALQIAAGGRDKLPFLKKDCRNYLDKQRRLRLKEGDAEAMYHYFTRMKADNENFYFAMDLDDDSRVRNVFWADARSRAACKEFGDVVTFDTTYLVNKYNMPFALFVGVTHHGQSTLLGCGLISKEDTESFTWLFQTWKACMRSCVLKAIITDQCLAMKNAIEIVFPDTRHRWCIWHIMKKLPEKFGGYNEFKNGTRLDYLSKHGSRWKHGSMYGKRGRHGTKWKHGSKYGTRRLHGSKYGTRRLHGSKNGTRLGYLSNIGWINLGKDRNQTNKPL